MNCTSLYNVSHEMCAILKDIVFWIFITKKDTPQRWDQSTVQHNTIFKSEETTLSWTNVFMVLQLKE